MPKSLLSFPAGRFFFNRSCLTRSMNDGDKRPSEMKYRVREVAMYKSRSLTAIFSCILSLSLLLSMVPLLASAQRVQADFEVDVVSVRGDVTGMTRVDLYSQIGITQISFINTPNGFTGGYEVKMDAIQISDDNRLRNLIQSKIWDASMTFDSYIETQMDDEFDFTTQSIDVAPGRYVFEFEVSDRNSNQTYLRSIPVEIRDLSADVAISDITLLESYDENTFTIVPRITGRIGSQEGGFKMFYELYSDGEKDVTVIQEVRRAREENAGTKAIGADGEGSPEMDLAYSKEELLFLGRSRSQYIVSVPMDEFKPGAYMMRVSVVELGGETRDVAEQRFMVEWSGLSDHIQNVDEAIVQMEYIAKKRDMSFILDAPNDIERFRRFTDFWDKRDPTPGTKRNEKQEEYYYRIASANQNFGGTHDGWKTDRGFVLVRFGDPDFVRRKPHSFDYEPYEIWEYQRIGRQFIFVDRTGFGDYELLVPIWDERTRLF